MGEGGEGGGGGRSPCSHREGASSPSKGLSRTRTRGDLLRVAAKSTFRISPVDSMWTLLYLEGDEEGRGGAHVGKRRRMGARRKL